MMQGEWQEIILSKRTFKFRVLNKITNKESFTLFRIGALEVTNPHIFSKYFEKEPYLIDENRIPWYRIKDDMRKDLG